MKKVLVMMLLIVVGLNAQEKKINFSFGVNNFNKMKDHYTEFINNEISQMNALMSEVDLHSRLVRDLKETLKINVERLKVKLEEVNRLEREYNLGIIE